MRGRRLVTQRQRIFLAGEGDSERAFVAWLRMLCDRSGLRMHLDSPRVSAGDPLALVTDALRERDRRTNMHGRYVRSAILIDTDRLDDGSARSRRALAVAERERLTILRQRPRFEAMLVRLFPSQERMEPTGQQIEAQLARLWPTYAKPPTGRDLDARFALTDLQRVAAVDAELAALLRMVGLPSE